MKNRSNSNKLAKAALVLALVVCMLFVLPACTIKRGELNEATPAGAASSTPALPEVTPSPSPTPSSTPELKKVLTITEIGMDMNTGLSGVKATDETGKEVELSGNPAEWFEGGSTFELTMPEGSSMIITPDGGFTLAEESSLDVSVVINGANQTFTLKVGSTFDYMLDSSGSIKLIPGGGSDVATTTTTAPQSDNVLTVTFVALEDMTTVGEVTCTNEKGEEVVLSSNWNDWFNSASIDGLELLDANGNQGSIHMVTADANPYSLGDGCHFKVTATIDGKKYTFDIGVGSKFHYNTVDGSIKLVVDEAFTPAE